MTDAAPKPRRGRPPGADKNGWPEKVARLLAMIDALPRDGSYATSEEVREHLFMEGFDTSTRTVERDFVSLELRLPPNTLVRYGKRPAYAWNPSVRLPALNAMNHDDALMMIVAHAYLRPFLPESARTLLRNYAAHATWCLASAASSPRRFYERLRAVDSGFRAALPPIAPAVLKEVYAALWRSEKCRLRWRPYDRAERTVEVDPYGLLIEEGSMTLVGRAEGDVQRFALHRVEHVDRLRRVHAPVPQGFDLASFDEGRLPALVGGPDSLAVVLHVEGRTQAAWRDRPLSDDQQLEPLADGRFAVRARLPNTRVTLAHLRSFGAEVEVREPPELRRLFADEATRAAAKYAEDPRA